MEIGHLVQVKNDLSLVLKILSLIKIQTDTSQRSICMDFQSLMLESDRNAEQRGDVGQAMVEGEMEGIGN